MKFIPNNIFTVMKCSIRALPLIDLLPILLIILTGIAALVLVAIDDLSTKTIIGLKIWTFILAVGTYVSLTTWAIIKTVQRQNLRKKLCSTANKHVIRQREVPRLTATMQEPSTEINDNYEQPDYPTQSPRLQRQDAVADLSDLGEEPVRRSPFQTYVQSSPGYEKVNPQHMSAPLDYEFSS